MKRGVLILGALSIIALCYGVAVVGIGGNLGLPFGYYGKLNRVRAEIERVPGLKITGETLHKDLTLEDFSFEVTNGTHKIWLPFATDGGQKTWQKFHEPGTKLRVAWTISDGLESRSFALGPDTKLSVACGRTVENLAQALEALDAILQHIGDPELLQQVDASGGAGQVTLYFDE